jgi:hypothetical protein
MTKKRYKLKLPDPMPTERRTPSKLKDALDAAYARRKGLDKKPLHEPELDAAYEKILREMKESS